MITKAVNAYALKTRALLTPRDKIDLAILILSIALLLYTFIMAAYSDITWDEAYTFMYYSDPMNPSFLKIDLANNHPLNSLLIYITAFLFPYNELAIRVPNIIFLVVYLVCAIKISKTCLPPLKPLVFALLVLYVYLIPKFFSMGRGYGISTSLVLLFLVNFTHKKQTFKNIVSNLYILLLASYAFTGLLPLIGAVMLYYLLFVIKGDLIKFLKRFYLDLVFLGVNFLFLAFFLMSVSETGKPLFGAYKKAFLTSTIGYYLGSFFKYMPSFSDTFLSIAMLVLFLAVGIYLIVKKQQAKVIIVTFSTFALFFITSKVFERPYITGRMLLPFYPLIIMSIIELLNILMGTIKQKIYLYSKISISLSIALLLNYVLTTNFSISNNNYNFKDQIFENFDLNVDDGGCCWGILTFYYRKFHEYPPVDALKQTYPNAQNVQITKHIKMHLFKEKKILLLESTPEADVETPFFLHISSADINNLPKKFQKKGYDNLKKLNWSANKKYLVRKLPNYEFDKITIGQIDKKNKVWEQTLKVN